VDTYGNTHRSTLASVQDPLRAFPDFQRRISIAQEDAYEGNKSLNDLRSRLGITTQYGCAGEQLVENEPTGEVDALTRAIERLTDTCRDIRGLAETLNASL